MILKKRRKESKEKFYKIVEEKEKNIELRRIMTRTKLNNVMQLAIHGTDKGFSLTAHYL